MREYANQMKRMVHDFKTGLRHVGEDGLMLMARYGLKPEDFSGGKNSTMGILRKWAQGDLAEPSATFVNNSESPRKWFTSSSEHRKTLDTTAQNSLMEIMQEGVRLFSEDYSHYLSAQAILSNFYQLGILADLDRKVREYCADQCIMLLSSTTELLNRLIGTADAPFIYEKVGVNIQHFMIDEFQDTSGLQWSNFMPLLSNSLAEGHHNLIVGDVKQSIYRWRGSDWGLLHTGLNNYETPLRIDDSTTLRTNWRSAAEVIGFNNEFFSHAARTMQNLYNESAAVLTDVFTGIYADVAQQVAPIRPQKGPGRVRVEFVEGKTKAEHMEAVMKRLPETVIELQRHGYAAGEIAILCRTNDICTESVQTMLRYRAEHPECPYVLDVISDEALRLSSRPAIRALISVLRYLHQPSSPLLRAVASASLLQLGARPMEEALRGYFGGEGDAEQLLRLAHRPLYEMVEELIHLLPEAVIRGEEPFLQAFRDLVLEFINGRTTDLTAFLAWWDESGTNKTIATPSRQDAVRVMTIHQSKGLGMPAVIIPYASWQLDIDTTRGMLWCEPQDPLFARENLVVPVQISSNMPRSIFHADFDRERMRSIIDNLNTAYVALTRAKEAMVLLTPQPTTPGSTSKSTSYLSRLERLLSDYVHCDSGTYERGEWVRPEQPELPPLEVTEPTAAPTPMPEPQDEGKSAPTTTHTLPRLSLKQSRLVAEDTAIRRGNAIHAALSAIEGTADADLRIDRLYARGELDPAVVEPAEMKSLVARLIREPQAAPWFADGVRILNEQTIVARGDVLKRPDRLVLYPDGRIVVVDYKTGRHHRTYPEQVRSYMRLLRDMGFPEVEGYLWYIVDGEIEQVE
jgi:ATP-dependent exoDNAse (exonuclease V) beta subunit